MLPVSLTRLLGRDELLDRLVGLLSTRRLVTLTGPGGCGKTRLATAVAHRAGGDRAQFVDLSAARPATLVATVGAALGVRDDPDQQLLDSVTDALGVDVPILVLDNSEHLVADCAQVALRLLARCPRLAVLVTSRRPLAVAGETVVAVPPLDLAAATQLFLDRAGTGGHRVPPASTGAVAALCAELDGLPLAIELAAGRTAVLTVEELLARVRLDVRLLRSPNPTVPERHRTLTAVVESSVGQLAGPQQVLLRRLAVFAGSFTPAAAEALQPPVGRCLPALDALVAVSLLEVEPARGPAGGPRYRMLGTVRRACLLLLRDAGEEPAARRAHAGYYLELVERAEPRLQGPAPAHWLDILTADWANLCAAMAWLGQPEAGGPEHGELRLAAALTTYCHLRGRYRDGLAWLAGALAGNPDAPAALLGRAGTGAALLAMLLCDYPAADGYASAARRHCRAAGDRRGQARLDTILGSVARERGEYVRSAAHLDAAAAGYAECGDEPGEARATLLRGFTAWIAGDFARAQPRLRVCLRWFEQLGDAEASATALAHLAAVALYRGDDERAGQLLEEALHRHAGLGFPEGVGWTHNLLGLVELRRGRTGAAAAYLTESLAVHRRVGDRWRTASVLCALAEVARRSGAAPRAARLLGAAAAIREAIDVPVPACELSDVDATGAALCDELGGARYAAEVDAGRAAPLDALLCGAGLG